PPLSNPGGSISAGVSGDVSVPRPVGPHHPGPLLPASPPSVREKREKDDQAGLLEPSLSRQVGGEAGRERGSPEGAQAAQSVRGPVGLTQCAGPSHHP